MKYLYAGIVFCLSIGLLMIKRAFENNLITHHIKLNDASTFPPLKVLFISDIHRRKIPEKWFRSLPGADLILIGGDMTEKGVPYERVQYNASLIAKAGKAYFVFGNNDEEVNKRKLTEIIEAEGITVLENESDIINDQIAIAGIGDINYQKDDLLKALSNVGEKDVILLSHDPRVTRKLSDVKHANQVRVILCGHTHGGQIRVMGFGPYQKGRLIKHQQYTQLISNGYGTTLIPMRLGAKSEVHLLTIS
ncbi:metallophosphoesterase [Jeotgalibacillus malaysiensis]|uniref:metallophosphoesterase n=1 Tax=Jeotgalibacillus malaysiensis TaxID=1508404 RepID=UPI00384DBEC9